MSKISLEKFINNTKGKKIAKTNGTYVGQCVSLVQQYLVQCLEQPEIARGDAKDWINSYVNEGLGHTVSDQRDGDLIVFPHEANGYGHIGIWYKGKIYDQNNKRHDDKKAGLCDVFSWDFVTLRPNTEVIVDEPKPQSKKLYLPADAESWRVYPMGVSPVKGNECGKLLPSKFGGLEYDILGYSQDNVAIIQTRDFGQVQIYVASSTGAVIR